MTDLLILYDLAFDINYISGVIALGGFNAAGYNIGMQEEQQYQYTPNSQPLVGRKKEPAEK
jgi:hypothetical protein